MKRKILQFILKILAKLYLLRYKPLVIAITGSVGKTSAKETVRAVLSSKFYVRCNKKNYNNEIGVPLSIIGLEILNKNIVYWIFGLLKSVFKLIYTNYPKILVLEIAADRPNDIKYLIDIIKPKIGIVTAIGEIPVHVEFFSGPEEVAKEKSKLIKSLPPNGWAILNYDDDVVLNMKNKTRARVITYGFGENAQIKCINYENRIKEIDGESVPDGIMFKVEYENNIIPFKLNNVFGKQQIYSALAAIAVGSIFDINMVNISEALINYQPPPGRMHLIKGIKHTYIIDDSYNASPLSMIAALETLAILPAKRKIVVLGDMLELGKYSLEAHRTIGEKASKIADYIFCVGDRAKFICSEAESLGFNKNNLFSFCTSDEAGKKIQEIIKKGDLILVKGSRAMKMEKVVLEIMAEPQKAKELIEFS